MNKTQIKTVNNIMVNDKNNSLGYMHDGDMNYILISGTAALILPEEIPANSNTFNASIYDYVVKMIESCKEENIILSHHRINQIANDMKKHNFNIPAKRAEYILKIGNGYFDIQELKKVMSLMPDDECELFSVAIPDREEKHMVLTCGAYNGLILTRFKSSLDSYCLVADYSIYDGYEFPVKEKPHYEYFSNKQMTILNSLYKTGCKCFCDDKIFIFCNGATAIRFKDINQVNELKTIFEYSEMNNSVLKALNDATGYDIPVSITINDVKAGMQETGLKAKHLKHTYNFTDMNTVMNASYLNWMLTIIGTDIVKFDSHAGNVKYCYLNNDSMDAIILPIMKMYKPNVA